MKPTQAFNVSIMELTRDKLARLDRVKVTDIYDGVSQNFHDEGLFSTRIFGEVGSEQRDVTFAYIKLNTKIFHPYAFDRIKRLKRLYEEILMGTRYATWDEKEKDFFPSTPLEGETGFAFFLKHFDKIKFRKNNSAKRNIIVDILNKNKEKLFLEEYLVLPAGLRDLFVDKSGKTTEDEVNDFYRRMISLANSLENVSGKHQDESQDVVRRNLQKVANDIYSYYQSLVTGKKGFAQAKWGGRNIFNGTRNVLSPMDTSAEVLGEDRSPSLHSVFIGLWQCMKGALPLTIHLIKTHPLYQMSFTGDQEYVTLISKDTLHRERIKADQKLIDNWQATEGLEKLIHRFGKEELRYRPISPLPTHWFGLIYVDDEKFQILSDIDELPEGWNKENVRPLKYIEFYYLVGYKKWYDLKLITTRYPVAGDGSTYPADVYVKTTATAKRLQEYIDGEPVENGWAREFPYVPLGGEPTYYNTQAVHPSRLPGLGGDHDGDVVSGNIVYTKESIEEINNYFDKRESLIGAGNDFKMEVVGEMVERIFSSFTGEPTHVR